MTRDGFFAGAARASLPLWLWALHFAACYVGVAVGCRAGWGEAAAGGPAPLRVALLVATALAAAASAALLVSACREATAPPRTLGAGVRLLASAVALAGIVWAGVPLLVLPLCRLA